MPLRTAWDSRPGRMAEFPAINPQLPNVLVHHTHVHVHMHMQSHTRTLRLHSRPAPVQRYGERWRGKQSVQQ